MGLGAGLQLGFTLEYFAFPWVVSTSRNEKLGLEVWGLGFFFFSDDYN